MSCDDTYQLYHNSFYALKKSGKSMLEMEEKMFSTQQSFYDILKYFFFFLLFIFSHFSLCSAHSSLLFPSFYEIYNYIISTIYLTNLMFFFLKFISFFFSYTSVSSCSMFSSSSYDHYQVIKHKKLSRKFPPFKLNLIFHFNTYQRLLTFPI